MYDPRQRSTSLGSLNASAQQRAGADGGELRVLRLHRGPPRLSANVRHTTLNRSRGLFWIGAFLLAASAYPLLLMAREVLTGYFVEARYRFKAIYESQTATIGGHQVSLLDDALESSDPSERIRGVVRIVIDGRVYATASNVEIRPSFRDANRYHGFLALVRFVNVSRGEAHVAVVANAAVDPTVPRLPNGGYNFDYLRFRVITLDSDGHVSDETFFRKDRGSPAFRAALARFVSPSPMGYYSDLMMVWPSFLYPIAFPWASGLVGAICILLAVRTLRRESGDA